MIAHRARSQFPFYLYIFLAALAVYAVQDVLTSANIGLKDPDRALVHLSLVAAIVILFLYCVFSFVRRPKWYPLMISLSLIFLWCLFVDIVQAEMVWFVAVRLGLAALWVLVYYFFRRYMFKFPRAIRRLGTSIAVFFVFYVVAAFYAAWNISEVYGRIAVVNMVYNVLVFLPWIF